MALFPHRSVLGNRGLRIERSTSVPKLAAKPVIDIPLVVVNSADEPSYITAREGLGYVLRIREPEWYEHRCSFRALLFFPNAEYGSCAEAKAVQGGPTYSRPLVIRPSYLVSEPVLYADIHAAPGC